MLSSLLDKAEAAAALNAESSQQSSRRPRREGFDLYPSLCGTVHGMLSSSAAATAAPGSSVEIEVRIGMLVDRASTSRMHPQLHQVGGCLTYEQDPSRTVPMGYEFKSGIDEDVVDRLRRSFAAEKFIEKVQPMQELRIDEAGNRWQVGEGGKAISVPEKKSRFGRCDMALLAHSYDIRIDGAIEKELSEQGTSALQLDKWVLKRIKKRSTFSFPPGLLWHIDLTEVESVANPSSSRVRTTTSASESGKETELEFELEASAVRHWLALPENERRARTELIAGQLLRLIDLCVSSNANAPADSKLLRADKETTAALLDSSKAIARECSKPADSFIGAMPVSISRKNMQHILKTPYFVTEKSDGSRKLLFVVKNPATGAATACVMDRAKTVDVLEGGDILGEALGLGTVLDGELVLNLSLRRYVFLAFDIIAHRGRVIADRPFSERLKVMQDEVLSRLRDVGSSGCTPVVGKTFYEKRRIGELLAKIKMANSRDRIYIDTDPKSQGLRHHRTDGLIFQPDAAYVMGTDANLIKWKYLDLMTIDLMVAEEKEGGALKLLCSGPESTLIDCTHTAAGTSSFGLFATLRLKADLQYLKGQESSRMRIVEVAYDPSIGVWIYFHFRDDKTAPNHIHTVMSVLMEQAESIELDELEYRLLARSEAENDFTTQVHKMRSRAMEFQRKRTSMP